MDGPDVITRPLKVEERGRRISVRAEQRGKDPH